MNREQDFDQFSAVMIATVDAMGGSMTPEAVDLWFDDLANYAIDAIKNALRIHRQRSKFPPKPAEIVEILEGNDADRASYAWSAFLGAAASGGMPSVKFLDVATAIAVDSVFGGWVHACRLLASGWVDDHGKEQGGCTDEMVASYRNHFLKVYAAARRNPRNVETYRPGLSELSMRNEQTPKRGQEIAGNWKARMATVVQPVLLIGEKATKEIKLPFDTQQGALTGEAMAQLTAGPRAAMAFAEAFTPALPARPPQRMLKAAPEPPATKDEVLAILAEAKIKLANSPKAAGYLKALEDAA